MIDISNMFMTQIFLLCMVVVGVITVKTRIVDDHTRVALSELVLSVFLPCNILSSFFGTSRSELPSLGIMLMIALGVMALSFTLSQVLYKRVNSEQKKVLVYGTIISNASLLGNPVVESVYGLQGLTYAAAYLVPFRIALWTVGPLVFAGGKGDIKKILFHPCLVATYTGLLVMIIGFNPPALVSRVVFSLGNCTTPLSMIVVGNVLAMVDPRKLLTKLIVYFTFVRLVLIPLIVIGFLLILRPAPIISGVSVILSGMPAGATTAILADKFGADRELASKIVFMSTLLSIITAPLLARLLQQAL